LIHTYFYTYYESPLKKVMQTALLKNDYWMLSGQSAISNELYTNVGPRMMRICIVRY
jgi:hypothetical protein